MKTNKLIYTFIFLSFFHFSYTQNLLSELENEFPKEKLYEIATFKTTKIGLSHSIETRKQGALEISMYNRYWNLPGEQGTQAFLADKVNTRFGLDYALTDNFTIGIGYSTFDEITDGTLKFKFLKQEKNAKGNPFSMVFLQKIAHQSNQKNSALFDDSAGALYSFTSQLLIARKFGPKFSAQVSPTFITRNQDFVNEDDSKNQFAVGLGARYKVGGHVSIVSEYYGVFDPITAADTYNPFMIGVNWELSHLLLQFQMTNVRNFSEDTFIPLTGNNFNFHDGKFHFGFNATFVLHFNKNKL